MTTDLDYVEQRRASSGGGSVVKQLKSQLKELSQATKQRNDYMEEMKKASAAAGVKARIASIESTIKSGPVTPAAPTPVNQEKGMWKYKSGTSSRSVSISKDESTAKPDLPLKTTAPTKMNSPTSPIMLESTNDGNSNDNSTNSSGNKNGKEVKVIVSPGLGKMTILPSSKESSSDSDTHLLRPSLARRISYVDITKKSFPSEKLTVTGVSNSLVKRNASESSESDD